VVLVALVAWFAFKGTSFFKDRIGASKPIAEAPAEH